jgi:hypothetical protein
MKVDKTTRQLDRVGYCLCYWVPAILFSLFGGILAMFAWGTGGLILGSFTLILLFLYGFAYALVMMSVGHQ